MQVSQLAPVQATLSKASQQLSFGLQGSQDDPEGAGLAISATQHADALVDAAGAFSMPGASKSLLSQAKPHLATAITLLGQQDDDGYPLQLNAGRDQMRVAMELIGQATNAAVTNPAT